MHINRTLLTASWQSWISNDTRHRAGPWWLQWLWTLLFSMSLAVPFTVLGLFAFACGHGDWHNLAGCCWLALTSRSGSATAQATTSSARY